MRFVSILFLTFVLVFCAPPASAEQHNAPPASAPAKPEGMQISILTLTLLIKGAVMALQQANMTGNYSVLRDLGTPVFRETFDQATLTAIFQNLRARKIDLSVAILLSPNLTKKPELNQNHELVLVGDFPTQPLRIHFELAFLQLDGMWRIAGMSVDAVPAQAVASAAAASGPAAASKPDGDWSATGTAKSVK